MTVEQFLRDLAAGYYQIVQTPLNRAYLTQLLTVFGELYARVPRQSDAYALYLKTCLVALRNFTQSINPALLEQPPTNAFFYIATNTFELLTDQDKNSWSYSDGQEAAFTSLAEPFRQIQKESETLGFNWSPARIGDEYDFLFRTYYSSDDEKTQARYDREHEKQLKEREKLVDEAYDNATPLQRCFNASPLLPFAQAFMPNFELSLPFEISPEKWFEGTWIVGAQGRGKSNLLRHLVMQLQENATIIILDAKGDLLKSFQRAAFLKDRLVLIEPDLDHPPAINPLDMGGNAVEFLTYLFALLQTDLSTNQAALFHGALTLLNQIPNATLDTFVDVLQHVPDKGPVRDAWYEMYDPYILKLRDRDQKFFQRDFHTRVYNDRKPEVLLKLRLMLSNPYLEAMFMAPKTRIDFGKLMDNGKVVCINNTYDPDTLTETGSEFFGRTIIALIWAAARRRASRPASEKTPVYVFIDEAHYVIKNDTTIAKIIQQCRSQKIAMIFAHQEIKQIDNEKVRNALDGCAIKFANTTGEAPEMAARLSTTPEFIKQQKRGQFAAYVLDKTDTAISLSVPLVPVRDDQTLTNARVMPQRDYKKLLKQMYDDYCWLPHPQPTQPLAKAQTDLGDNDTAALVEDATRKKGW